MLKETLSKIKLQDLRITAGSYYLRPPRFSDAPQICKIVRDKTILQNTNIPYPVTLAKEREFVRDMQVKARNQTDFVWMITDSKTKKIIGAIGLHQIHQQNKNAEIGYWLAKKYRGQGIMSAVARKILDLAFKKIKLHKVYLRVFADNPSSVKVAEKLGFQQEGYHRQEVYRWNKWRDDIWFGLLREDFEDKD